jgi:hypothetical protein
MVRFAAYLALSTIAAFLAAGCDAGDETATTPSTAADKQALPEGLVLATAPEGARGVAETRAKSQEGEEVVVRGVVAGSAQPLAENRAILMLLDESIETCDRMEMDEGCTTPWDACCSPPETVSANAATVQVVDGEGRPLKTGLGEIADLGPLSRVVVTGTFHPSPDGKAAIINATGIHVEK